MPPTGRDKIVIVSGSNIKEDFPVLLPSTSSKVPKWVYSVQKCASFVKAAVPGVSDMLDIANNGAEAHFKKRAFNKGMNFATSKIDKGIKQITSDSRGALTPKIDIKIKGAKIASVDLVQELSSMIVNDIAKEFDEAFDAVVIAELLLCDDYVDFMDKVIKYTNNTAFEIVVLYSNKPLISADGGIYREPNLKPTSFLRGLDFLAQRDEYGGFVPKYVSWGFKKGFTKEGLVIQRTLKLDFKKYDIEIEPYK